MHNIEIPPGRRPPMPPKPPFFGIRIHPVTLILGVLALVALAAAICLLVNPRFGQGANPFGQSPFQQ